MFENKKIVAFVSLLVLMVGLGVGTYLATRQQGEFDLRKKAAEVQGSQLLFKGPQKVNVGEKFSVDLFLDTTTDFQYTISGVDAMVLYQFEGIPVTTPCPLPKVACPSLMPPLCNNGVLIPVSPVDTCGCAPPPKCIQFDERTGGGITYEENLVMEKMLQQVGLALVSITPGKIFDSYPTQGPSAGDGGGILPGEGCVGPNCPQTSPLKPCGGIVGETCLGGYECIYSDGNKRPPYPDAQGVCYFVDKPLPVPSNSLAISGIKNYSVSDKGYFNGFIGQGIFATLTFVAQRPGKTIISLVYKNPSATDDTNINGFLANQPMNLQKTQERLLSTPQTLTIEVTSAQQQTPTPTPTCQPRPSCLDTQPSCKLVEPVSGWCQPTPTPTPPVGCHYQSVQCVKAPCDLILVCPTPTPTPTSRLSFTLSDINGVPVRQTVKIFAKPAYTEALTSVQGATTYATKFSDLIKSDTSSAKTPPTPNRDNLVLLGETQTDTSGTGNINIKNEYLSRPWALYAQTTSHLIRYMQINIFPVWFNPDKTVEVKFDKLIAGDIYVASGQDRQDGVINNFDVADLFQLWGPYPQLTVVPPPPPLSADFNGDGVVNNRDLAILLSNFGKRGDIQQETSTGKRSNFAGILRLAGSNIYQWGTHTLTAKDGTVYQVRAISGAKELLTRYEGMQVVVFGTLDIQQLEGGFWGITADGVVVDESGKNPIPAQ